MASQPPHRFRCAGGRKREAKMTLETLDHQIEVEAESARRIAQVKQDKSFMAGVFRAMKDPTPPIPWKDLKRK
jgi:hypothetical protein